MVKSISITSCCNALKYPFFSIKIYKTCKETGKCDKHRKKEQTILSEFEGSSNVGFNRQKLQNRYYKYVQNIKKTMFKELKIGMMIMY